MHTTTIQTQDGRGPCCGCTQITYYPLDLDNGSKAERWTCAVPGGCGREFVPRARAERAERELGEYQAKACEDLAAAWRERDEARGKLADCESYHRECGDCGKMQTFIGKGLFECYSCAWREASEDVRALQAKLAEAETFRREWGEAHNRLTTLTDELLGPAPTMPLLALIERLERADPRAQLAKTEAVVEAARSVIKEMWRLPESSMLRTKLHVLAGVLRDLDEDSGGSGELASAKPNDAGRRVPASTGPHAASREEPEPAGSSLDPEAPHGGSGAAQQATQTGERNDELWRSDSGSEERSNGPTSGLEREGDAPVPGGQLLDAGSRRCPRGRGEAVRAGDLHVHGSAEAPTGMVGESGGHADGRLGGSGLAPDTAVAAYSKPAGSSHDPLAALEAAVGRPLTAEDRDRIQGVVARLRPDVPRGGLLPEPWERGPRPDYATRSEIEELRRRIEKMEAGK